MTISRLDLTAYYYRFELMLYDSDDMPYPSVRIYRNDAFVDIDYLEPNSLMLTDVKDIPRPLLNACIAFSETPTDARHYKAYDTRKLEPFRERIKRERP